MKERTNLKKVSEQAMRVLDTISNVWSLLLLSFASLTLVLAIDFLDLNPTSYRIWDQFYSASTSVLGGVVGSIIIYLIVVHFPERKKRKITKKFFKKFYREIKEDILLEVISASINGGRKDLVADQSTIARLLTIEGFRETFKGGSEGNEGFYAFRNWISDDVAEYREIVLNLRLLARQIEYLLHNYPISDARIFSFFKRLENFLIKLEAVGPGYNEEKLLSRFIWEIYAGTNIIDGFIGYDVVERTIEEM